jgi:hypothetical protein
MEKGIDWCCTAIPHNNTTAPSAFLGAVITYETPFVYVTLIVPVMLAWNSQK